MCSTLSLVYLDSVFDMSPILPSDYDHIFTKARLTVMQILFAMITGQNIMIKAIG